MGEHSTESSTLFSCICLSIHRGTLYTNIFIGWLFLFLVKHFVGHMRFFKLKTPMRSNTIQNKRPKEAISETGAGTQSFQYGNQYLM